MILALAFTGYLLIVPPVEREDGSALPDAEIAGYEGSIQYANGGSLYFYKTNEGYTDLIPVEFDSDGYHYVCVKTIDTDGRESKKVCKIIKFKGSDPVEICK